MNVLCTATVSVNHCIASNCQLEAFNHILIADSMLLLFYHCFDAKIHNTGTKFWIHFIRSQECWPWISLPSLFFLIHYFLGLTEDCYNFKHLFLLYMYYLSLVLHWKVYVLLEMTVLVTVSDLSTVTDGGRLIYRITLILFIPSFQASKTKRQGVAWLYGRSPAGAHSTSQTKLKCHSYISHSNYCFSFTKKTIFLSSVAIGGYVCHQLKDCHCMKKREQAGPWARVFEQWK